ncbi:MAG: DUF1156 domain-containing protein [Candidatus Nanohaloarchaea archaeon]
MTKEDKLIEHSLPVKTIGIESERERKGKFPPLNRMHVWWARRPLIASRTAILSSIINSEQMDSGELLERMGITGNTVEKYKTKDDRPDGMLVYEHYGYRRPFQQDIEEEDLARIKEAVRSSWDGEMPTVLDPTAGGGSIPFESIRHDLPTIANELNPVASVLLKASLEMPRTDEDLSEDIKEYGQKINAEVRKELQDYFPSEDGKRTLEYLWAHTVQCPDCGLTIPLSPNWWLNKESSNEGTAVKPEVSNDEDKVEFEVVELPRDIEKSEYNPTKGTISYGKATCPRCEVTVEGDDIKEQAQNEGLGEQLYAVRIEDKGKTSTGRYYRSPEDIDNEAYSKATEKINSDIELSTFLSEEIPKGEKTDEPRRYGITKWREMFNDRQLLTHRAYLDKFESYKDKIKAEYDEKEARVILTYLTLVEDKMLSYNCRLDRWDPGTPKISQIFERHDFAFQWSFAESNQCAEGLGYEWALDSVIGTYEELRSYSKHSKSDIQIQNKDGRNLDIENGEVDAVVMDPPYYDNVMYAELSDFFYVWMEKYLGDVYPEFFDSQLTEKEEEAVANPSKFEDVQTEDQSKSELAKEDYERKMTQIFDEMNRVLSDEGIMTLMFTHKKTEAWDTLTKGLMQSGFVVKSSHPISTESSRSLHQSGKNAAKSTIFLSARKREDEGDIVLWKDVKEQTRKAARDRAKELDKKNVEFSKVDMILAAFGPTLEVFTKNYPVVDSEENEVEPQEALDEARAAVRDYLIESYLNDGVRDVDTKTEWYILSWLIFEAERFPYDEGRRLALGVGENLDDLKKAHRMWRKKSGDILLRPHEDRVQDIMKSKEDRSSRRPVDPEAISFKSSLDKVHAAMHVYKMKGERDALSWMKERNYGSDPSFKATLEGLLRVIPKSNLEFDAARDLTTGKTGEYLDVEVRTSSINKKIEDRQTKFEEHME